MYSGWEFINQDPIAFMFHPKGAVCFDSSDRLHSEIAKKKNKKRKKKTKSSLDYFMGYEDSTTE